jgi:hypothetical protein
MSFALVRGFHHSPLAAGLRLAIIPVALGIVAPFSGALHERLGVRTVLLSGMAVCVVALILLSVALTGAGSSVHSVMIALAVFGAGLGMFIAPQQQRDVERRTKRSCRGGGRPAESDAGFWHQCRSRVHIGGAVMAARSGDRDWRPYVGCGGRRPARSGERWASAAGRVRGHRRRHIGVPGAATRSRVEGRRLTGQCSSLIRYSARINLVAAYPAKAAR